MLANATLRALVALAGALTAAVLDAAVGLRLGLER